MAFRCDYTIFELSSNSINFECCIKTCEYFILTIKENCQMNYCRKFGNKQNYVPFSNSLISWHLSRQIMPGGGHFVSFSSTQGPEFCTEKLSPGLGF